MDSTTRLKHAFATALGIPSTSDFDHLTFQQIPEWDSVGHLQLISAIETEFDVMIDTDDVLDLSSFSMAKTILAKYGVAFGT